MIQKIIIGIVSALFIIMLILLILWYMANRNSPVQNNDNYIGSKACGECHPEKHATWAKTSHSKSFEEITKDHNPIIPEWSGTLTFKEGKIPEVTIKLEKTAEGIHRVTMRDAINNRIEKTYNVTRVSGGHGWKQRYYTQIGEDFYMLPMDWNQRIGQWTPFTLPIWWKRSGELRKAPFKFLSFGALCAGCHQTGVVTTLGFTGYRKSTISEPVIGCEKCHGPGAEHKDEPELNKTINPKKLTFERQVEVCGQCHGYGRSAPMGILSRYPMKEFGGEMYRPGEDLTDYLKPKPILWEGTPFSKKHRQQFYDFQLSGHYAGKIGCTGCHDPHGNEKKYDLLSSIDNLRSMLKYSTINF